MGKWFLCSKVTLHFSFTVHSLSFFSLSTFSLSFPLSFLICAMSLRLQDIMVMHISRKQTGVRSKTQAEGGNHVCISLLWRELLHRFYIRPERDRGGRLWFDLSEGTKPKRDVFVSRFVVCMCVEFIVHVLMYTACASMTGSQGRGVWGQQSRV